MSRKVAFALFLVSLSVRADNWWWRAGGTSCPIAGDSSTAKFCLVATNQTAGCDSSIVADTGQALTLSTSSASYSISPINSATVTKCSSNNNARVDASKGLLEEGAVTPANSAQKSEDFSGWTATTTTVTTDTTAAPDGTTTADTLQSTSNGGEVQSAALTSFATNNTGYELSAWAKVASSTQNFTIGLWDVTSAASIGTCGTLTATTTWQRFACSQIVGTATGHTYAMRIYPGGTGGTGTIIAWGAMATLAGKNTVVSIQPLLQYMPTGAAAVTGTGDLYSASPSGAIDYSGSWSMSFDWTPEYTTPSSGGAALSFFMAWTAASTTHNNTALLLSGYNSTTGHPQIKTTNASGTSTTSSFTSTCSVCASGGGCAFVAGTTYHWLITWTGGNTLTLKLNGASCGTATPTNFPGAAADTLYIGSNGSNAQGGGSDGWTKNVCSDNSGGGCA